MNNSVPHGILKIFGFLVFLSLGIQPTAKSQGSLNVLLLATFNEYSAAGYNDCWGYTAPDGREYALLGVRNGTSIIDITDTPALHEVAFIPSVFSTWKDIKTYRQYAYVVTDASGEGIQIIDLSMLPDTAWLIKAYTGSGGTSHNLSIDTSNALLYMEGTSGFPVRVISLSDPENLSELSTFGIECHDVYVQNNIAYVAEGFSGSVGIYSLVNPLQPALLRRFSIPSPGYVHNTWVSADGTVLMTTEETPGKTVKLWDISDLDAITPVSQYLAAEQLAHNVHIKGSFAYISHYKDGLRIVDISNPESISEVGYYDTYDSTLTEPFHGAWGAFPFFNSGKILISDMESGLFVVYFSGSVVSVPGGGTGVPSEFSLRQNYPNPFNPTTTIPFDLPEGGRIRLSVYDLLGREVAAVADDVLPAGSHSVLFSAGQLPSGTYFYRLQSPGGVMTRKMSLVR